MIAVNFCFFTGKIYFLKAKPYEWKKGIKGAIYLYS